jgi:hypothetical protein
LSDKRNTTIQYKCIEGRPEQSLLQEFVNLNQMLFGFNESVENMECFFQTHRMILGCYAFQNDVLIGYKLGFEKEQFSFESWRGGVIKHMRRKGIAIELMRLQHTWCQKNHFQVITTMANADNIPMLTLNHQHGFKVIRQFKNHRNILKVHLQKNL